MTTGFQALAGTLLQSKSVDEVLAGNNSKYLGEGKFKVKVAAVDCSKIAEKNYIDVTYEAEDGKTCRDFIFLMNYQKDGFSAAFKSLVAAAFVCSDASKTVDAQRKFIEFCGKDPEACGVFTGMKLEIENQREKGAGKFLVKNTGEGKYVAVDSEDETSVLAGPMETAKEVVEFAEAKDFKQARIKTVRRSAVDGERNIQILNAALSAGSAPKGAAGNSGMPKFI